jgi:hypothetical protein
MPLLKLLEIMGATKQMFTGIALKGFMKTLGEDLQMFEAQLTKEGSNK